MTRVFSTSFIASANSPSLKSRSALLSSSLACRLRAWSSGLCVFLRKLIGGGRPNRGWLGCRSSLGRVFDDAEEIRLIVHVVQIGVGELLGAVLQLHGGP